MRPVYDDAFIVELKIACRALRDDPRVNPTRVCPVCRLQDTTVTGGIRYDTFGSMMRHWQAVHPNEVPGHTMDRRRSVSGFEDFIPIYIDHMDKADIDRWVRDQANHPNESAKVYQELSNRTWLNSGAGPA